MTKKFLAAVAGAALAIALVGGFSAALASKGENSGPGVPRCFGSAAS